MWVEVRGTCNGIHVVAHKGRNAKISVEFCGYPLAVDGFNLQLFDAPSVSGSGRKLNPVDVGQFEKLFYVCSDKTIGINTVAVGIVDKINGEGEIACTSM